MSKLRSPREIIGSTLIEAVATHPNLLVLDADLGRSTRLTAFEERYSDRYIQLGVAEQNAVGMASGLIYAGYRPVFVTFTMFAIGLPWTQLRQAAYAGLPLKIIATHPGFDIGPDGGTHQMMEDLALARAIPELVILAPCDTPETSAAIRAALDSDRATYVRVGRHPVPDLHEKVDMFPIGEAEILHEGVGRLLLIADGSMASTAMSAADQLRKLGMDSTVINARTIKPLDEDTLRKRAQTADLVVTIENHSVVGGLGDAVSGALAGQIHSILRIGSPDVFGQTGTTDELRSLHGLDVEGVVRQIRSRLES